jgi:hypothetical protein
MTRAGNDNRPGNTRRRMKDVDCLLVLTIICLLTIRYHAFYQEYRVFRPFPFFIGTFMRKYLDKH